MEEGHIPVLTASHFAELTLRNQGTEWFRLIRRLRDPKRSKQHQKDSDRLGLRGAVMVL